MGIEVAIVTEKHAVVQQVTDSRAVIARLARTRWHKLTTSVCLRFVEPWGDAVFNQSQVPLLLSELRAEIEAAQSDGDREHLLEVSALVESAQNRVHLYVKFIGD